jgi:hypothetical protein
MVDYRHSRYKRRQRIMLCGISLVWTSIALYVNMGDAGRPFRTEDKRPFPSEVLRGVSVGRPSRAMASPRAIFSGGFGAARGRSISTSQASSG